MAQTILPKSHLIFLYKQTRYTLQVQHNHWKIRSLT